LRNIPLTQAGLIIGTPAFMSPERCGGDGDLTSASDICSLGALGYYLLTGKPVFEGKTPMQTLAAHLYETPSAVRARAPDVPLPLDDIIRRCLLKAPADRYQSAADVARALHDSIEPLRWTMKDATAWWTAVGVSQEPSLT
jgi:serine/threonine-protein kinase